MKRKIFYDFDNIILLLSQYLRTERMHFDNVHLAEESHSLNNVDEYTFELIIPELSDEDDYAPWLGLRLKEIDGKFELEISIVKGYGPVYEQDLVAFTEDSFDESKVKDNVFKMGERFVSIFKNNYLKNI